MVQPSDWPGNFVGMPYDRQADFDGTDAQALTVSSLPGRAAASVPQCSIGTLMTVVTLTAIVWMVKTQTSPLPFFH
jgi:hypothetical protein